MIRNPILSGKLIYNVIAFCTAATMDHRIQIIRPSWCGFTQTYV